MKEFEGFWEIYEEAFPMDERRSKQEQQMINQNPMYKITALYEENQIVGFICTWDLEEFWFVEHFAIKNEYRGKGLGTRMFHSFIQECMKNLILEVEPPITVMAMRRIHFYKRLGFHLSTYDYQQPPLGKGKKTVKLLLMSYPRKILKQNIGEIEEKIHTNVYHTTDYLKNQEYKL